MATATLNPNVDYAKVWRDATVSALDALAHTATYAAEHAYVDSRTEPDPVVHAALLAAVSAAQDASRAAHDAMRAIVGPEADSCAYCGTVAQVAYRQRGDLYLCQRCYVNHAAV